jgi:plastocyanin
MFRAFAVIAVMSMFLSMALFGPSLHGNESGTTLKAARNFEVRMKGNQFDQKDITVSIGDTVRWVNEDNGKHSVTADTGSALPIKEMVVDGGSFTDRITFDKAGVLNYHCKFHANMKGTVTVKQ